jgi:peptidyl-prolyl cis-trans isomerase SurA
VENNRSSTKSCHLSWVVAALLNLALPWAAAQAEPTHVAIAAIVGDDVITTTDLAERRDLIMAISAIPATPENQKKITPRILQSLIDETLELQEAKRQSFTITDDEVSKALAELSATHNQQPGSLKDFVRDHGLSMHSLENQFRAQLAWTKVVQRKLRHNVTISQDEITRAQEAQASAPGANELHLAAITIPATSPAAFTDATARAEEIEGQVKKGESLPDIAAHYLGRSDVQFSPPAWMAEDTLPPMIQQALRDLKPGETTPPLRATSSIQFLQMLDRRVVKKEEGASEVTIKQITVPVPARRTKPMLQKLDKTVDALRASPGSCMDTNLPAMELPAQASFAHAKMGMLNPDQRAVLAHLEVGDVSAPLPGPDAVRLIMLCEKIEPAAGNLPDAEEVRKQLFTAKLELEAEKELRNLRRDTFIDIKGD